ncbi:MAG: hypothetical protein WA970_04050 [Gammaproteobacteria bacterium]|nr:hypothetical protein [Gammaproteobacteria bacterium]
MSYGTDFKAGGDATATAEGHQSNFDSAKLINKGFDLGVANPDIQSDEDVVLQGQNVQAGAFGGHGGQDNVYQNTSV